MYKTQYVGRIQLSVNTCLERTVSAKRIFKQLSPCRNGRHPDIVQRLDKPFFIMNEQNDGMVANTAITNKVFPQ